MELSNSDKILLQYITNYCDVITDSVRELSLNEDIITKRENYRGMLAFFIEQIGECANKLSKDFREAHPEIEWEAIVGFRHHIVHAYTGIIPNILWDTVVNDVPALHEFCEQCLVKN